MSALNILGIVALVVFWGGLFGLTVVGTGWKAAFGLWAFALGGTALLCGGVYAAGA